MSEESNNNPTSAVPSTGLVGTRLQQDVIAPDGQIVIPARRLVTRKLLDLALEKQCDLKGVQIVKAPTRKSKNINQMSKDLVVLRRNLERAFESLARLESRVNTWDENVPTTDVSHGAE